jgi:hypothetical protein
MLTKIKNYPLIVFLFFNTFLFAQPPAEDDTIDPPAALIDNYKYLLMFLGVTMIFLVYRKNNFFVNQKRKN